MEKTLEVATLKNFCTLFDSGFSSRGLLMMESLSSVLPEAKVFVLCMDETVESLLKTLGNPQWVPVPLRDIETPELLAVKPTRSRAEYCWTNTAQILLHCLETLGLPECTYVDADLWFFSDPTVAIRENPEASVLLTEHWYTPLYDQALLSGRFCVQFMYFRRDQAGLKALHWWAEACLAWCFARLEDGKFGDQKYLDDWPERFPGVHVLQHRGIGVAPWNVQQVTWDPSGPETPGTIRVAGAEWPLVFYHFHQVRLLKDGSAWLGAYRLGAKVKRGLYYPYLRALGQTAQRLRRLGVTTDVHALQASPHPLRRLASWLKHAPTGHWNVEYRVPERFHWEP